MTDRLWLCLFLFFDDRYYTPPPQIVNTYYKEIFLDTSNFPMLLCVLSEQLPLFSLQQIWRSGGTCLPDGAGRLCVSVV
jgi:hypothetical protein